jgi:serine/threonine protein kinase
MKDDTSIFGAKSDNLDRLLRFALEPPDDENQAAQTASLDTLTEKPGGRIDKYKLLRILGEGGMGVVYLAEQEEPVKRQVALKVIKPGMDSKRVIARFEAEKQALALMQHPNIAGVYDAGITLTGRPYFVMEYVKGMPITDYCDHNKLTINERLQLFQQVCQAIQHAHQKGIIHRDIKPSNILVSVENGQTIPKIIDFGVAKATGKPLTKRTIATEDTQLLGTPEYMSPEQADLATEDIDTRSDVYSLGVLLYVLLTGVLPFDAEKLRDNGIENFRKTIRQTDPKTPSTRLTKLGEEAKLIAQNRGIDINTLAKHLRKELEWIPLKAMRKEQSGRYQSASELADDIENYLTGKPLIAGPPTSYYRMKKFAKRNAVLTTAALAVASTLLLGLAGIGIMYFRADKALVEATAISDFLVNDILGDDNLSEIQELDPDYIFSNATKKLDGKFENQPLVEARIRSTLGQRYLNIDKPELARGHLEKAYQIYLQHYGPEHQQTIKTVNSICWADVSEGRRDKAIERWTEQIEIIRREYGELHGLGMMFMMNIGQTYVCLGRNREAEEWLDKTLELCERSKSTRMPYVRRMARNHQGWNYTVQGRYDEAEEIYIKILQEEPNSRNAKFLEYRTKLSEIYRKQGQYDKAQQLCEATLGTMRQELGNEHSVTLRTMCCLGRILTDQGIFVEAESLLTEALKCQRLKFGDYHKDTLTTVNSLAVLYKEQARYAEAEKYFLEAIEGRRLKLGDKHPHTLESWNNLIDLYETCNKPEKAEEYRARLPQVKPGMEYDRPALIRYDTFASIGKISWEDANDTYTMLGSGRDIWYGADQFHYAHSMLNGDGSITARIESVEYLREWTKAGVMIRETTAANSAFAAVFITPQNRICFQYRPAMDKDVISIHSEPNAITLPCWVRLIREGNTFKAQHSADGREWKDLEIASRSGAVMATLPAVVEIDMSDSVHIGLAVCSHAGPGTPAEAKMSNVILSGDVDLPPGASFRLEAIGFPINASPRE